MTLGEKLKQTRLEAGLSQRQLCGDVITRNMLSQIENGSARPSMDTLRYLAAKLEKPMAYFLEDEVQCSPNQQGMLAAREALERGDDFAVLECLRDFREPDPIFAVERNLLEYLALLGAAEKALQDRRKLYALDLLTRAEQRESTYTRHLRRQRLLLLAKAGGKTTEVAGMLPSLDEELMLRAEAALEMGQLGRSAALLDSVENQTLPQWNLLRGRVYMTQRQYAEAIRHLHRAEEQCLEEVAPALERCYRELEDFKQAYHYACIQKKQE